MKYPEYFTIRGLTIQNHSKLPVCVFVCAVLCVCVCVICASIHVLLCMWYMCRYLCALLCVVYVQLFVCSCVLVYVRPQGRRCAILQEPPHLFFWTRSLTETWIWSCNQAELIGFGASGVFQSLFPQASVYKPWPPTPGSLGGHWESTSSLYVCTTVISMPESLLHHIHILGHGCFLNFLTVTHDFTSRVNSPG